MACSAINFIVTDPAGANWLATTLIVAALVATAVVPTDFTVGVQLWLFSL